jgi:hypothetical protein
LIEQLRLAYPDAEKKFHQKIPDDHWYHRYGESITKSALLRAEQKGWYLLQ